MEHPKARLRWLCRRGMKELDVLLAGFLDAHYDDAPPAIQQAFHDLLERQDPDVYALLTGRIIADDPTLADVVARIRRTARS